MRIGDIELAIIDVITFTGILITFLTGVINLFQNKKSLYINNITRFRVIWITTLRTHIASLKELSDITNLYVRTKEGTNKITYRRELEKVVALIKLHLNFTGKLDNELIAKVEALKAILNSYLLIYYCRNTINSVENDDELVSKFNEIIEVICEKKILKDILNIVVSNKTLENIYEVKKLNLLELKKQVKLVYMNRPELIRAIIKESDYLIEHYEIDIESINNDIDEIMQIYLKAEWIRCKTETKIWPYNIYNEEKIIKELKRKARERK